MAGLDGCQLCHTSHAGAEESSCTSHRFVGAFAGANSGSCKMHFEDGIEKPIRLGYSNSGAGFQTCMR